MCGSIGYIATDELRLLLPPGTRDAAVYDPKVGPMPGPSTLPDFDNEGEGAPPPDRAPDLPLSPL